MFHRRQAAPGCRSRAALTLVEVVVALVIFAVGMIGLELALVTLARDVRVARERLRASELAVWRYERTAGATCASASGTDRLGSLSVAWSVAPFSPRAVVVSQEARLQTGDGARALHFEGVVGCR